MQQTLTVATPDDATLVAPARAMLDAARDFEIDSPALEAEAIAELSRIAATRNRLTEERLAITRPLDESKKLVMAKYAIPLGALEEADGYLRRSLLSYRKRLEAQRAEQQRIADEAARKERERIEAEARKADEAAAALRAKAAAEEEAGNAKKAAKLAEQAAAKEDTATTLASAAAFVPTVVIAAPAPAAKGASTVKRRVTRCTDKLALLAFVVANPQYENLVDVNSKALGDLGKALGAAFNIPGCSVEEETGLAVRAR